MPQAPERPGGGCGRPPPRLDRRLRLSPASADAAATRAWAAALLAHSTSAAAVTAGLVTFLALPALSPLFGPDLVRASSYSVAFCSCIGIVRVSSAAARPLSAPHSPARPSVSFPPLLQPSYRINYMDAQHGPDPMLSYYGANSGRLQETKARMDPTGYFSAHPLAIPLAAGPLPPVPAPDGGIPPAIGPAALPPAPVPAPAPAPSSSGAMLRGALLSAALALLAAALLH